MTEFSPEELKELETELEELERTDPRVGEAAARWESLRQRVADGSLDIASNIWGKNGVDNYEYLDANLKMMWVSCVPKSDDEAYDYFHFLWSNKIPAIYVQVKRGGGKDYELMDYKFNPETGKVEPLA